MRLMAEKARIVSEGAGALPLGGGTDRQGRSGPDCLRRVRRQYRPSQILRADRGGSMTDKRDRELGMDRADRPARLSSMVWRLARRRFRAGVAHGATAQIGQHTGSARLLPSHPQQACAAVIRARSKRRTVCAMARSGITPETGRRSRRLRSGCGRRRHQRLSAAHFFRAAKPNARILILENHDDFGGHAKRNEYRTRTAGCIC